MRVVIALGGNALLRRGEPLTAEAQRSNVRRAAAAIAPVAMEHEVVITHGNGPQVGLLSLQAQAYDPASEVSLDVLGAESEGWIGYVIEQELGNVLPFDFPIATVLTMVEVDPEDPAFRHPTKPIGPVYTREEANWLASKNGWTVTEDGAGWRRVVASPIPRRIFETRPIRWLVEKGAVVICGGGGGIPTMYGEDGRLRGVDVVVDKDRASALLAFELEADLLVLATDVEGVFEHFGTPRQKLVNRVTPDEILGIEVPDGSMGPKVEAAANFVRRAHRPAVIGSLERIGELVRLDGGTVVVPEESAP